MSEIENNVQENTGTEQTVENGTETTGSTSIINQAVEAVMDLIDNLGLYAEISRGALGTGDSLSCEIGPTTPETVWLDKNQYIPIDLTVNGKHVTTNLYAPHRVELKDHLVLGKNTIELTIVNNLRNMMGPHHLFREECRWVCPGIFYKESNIFEHLPGKTAACHDVLLHFNDNYLLGRFGLK